MEVLVDDSSQLQGIFYQDTLMKEAYSQYPDLLFLDATYKLNDRRMPLFIFLGEDGNGESKVVAVCVVVNESQCLSNPELILLCQGAHFLILSRVSMSLGT